ncbi:hypothetical protein CPAV1605_779 [seawater metagenome]|uniref:Uncharacterized protein n=1 Tax=seawater metagenome TaxID=1561972 RepID=A0A5E8CK60_9ZZZZ
MHNNYKITRYVNQLEKSIKTPLLNKNNNKYFLSIVTMFKYEDNYLVIIIILKNKWVNHRKLY